MRSTRGDELTYNTMKTGGAWCTAPRRLRLPRLLGEMLSTMTNLLEEHQWWFSGLPSLECPGLQQLEKEEKEGMNGRCRTLLGGPNRNAEE